MVRGTNWKAQIKRGDNVNCLIFKVDVVFEKPCSSILKRIEKKMCSSIVFRKLSSTILRLGERM